MIIPEGFEKSTLKKYPELKRFYESLGTPTFMEIEMPTDYGRIIAKCDWNHPGETIKAKVAIAMLWNLLDNLKEKKEDITILEYSGGGLSLALSRLCNLLKIKSVLVLMDKTPKSIINTLKKNGATVELSDSRYGFWGVMEKAFELSKRNPEWKFLYQHTNNANYLFHHHITGKEILDQNIPDINAWVTSIGTGGTLIGVYDMLKKRYPHLELHTNMPAEMPYGSMEPSNSKPKFSGSGGLGCGRKQIFVERREREIVQHHLVSFEDAEEEMKNFYSKYGIFIGSSAAANLICAKEIAKKLGKGSTVLTVFQSLALPEEKAKIMN